jgi:hypothetical protein
MSLDPQQLEELESLLSELVDERLTDEHACRLQELLASEPEARDHYVRLMALYSDLYEFAAISLSVGTEEESPGCEPGLGETGPRVVAVGFDVRRWGGFVAVLMAALLVAVTFASMLRPFWRRTPAALETGETIGRISDVAGQVEIVSGPSPGTPATSGMTLRLGQTLLTQGPDSSATLWLDDGTLIRVANDTRAVFAAENRDRIDVESGNVTASVPPRPTDRPLVIRTPEAEVEVLGTRISVATNDRRTEVNVLEGEIRVLRLSDQRSVQLGRGQAAEVSPFADLQPKPFSVVPDTWSLDFADGLPSGWELGQLVFEDLPADSRAAVRTAGVDANGQRRYQLRSHNAWSNGLFTLHDDSWIHIRYRLERPGTFLLYVVCRQHDFGEPVCTVLTPGNLRQAEAQQWHTLALPLKQLHRTRTADTIALRGQLVAFCLAFDSPEHNPGLTIESVWVTREGNGRKSLPE